MVFESWVFTKTTTGCDSKRGRRRLCCACWVVAYFEVVAVGFERMTADSNASGLVVKENKNDELSTAMLSNE